LVAKADPLGQGISQDKGWIGRVLAAGRIAALPKLVAVRGNAEVAFAQDDSEAIGSSFIYGARPSRGPGAAYLVGRGLDLVTAVHRIERGISDGREYYEDRQHEQHFEHGESSARAVHVITLMLRRSQNRARSCKPQGAGLGYFQLSITTPLGA